MLNNRRWRGLAVTICVIATVRTTAGSFTGELTPKRQMAEVLPTELLHRANAALVGADRSRQPEIVRPLLATAVTTGLSVDEELALAELHFLAFNPREADAIFSRYLDRTDRIGRMAWIRHQQIQFRAFDKHDETEPAIAEFRKRFPVSPDDLTYTSSMVFNQANRYALRGDHDKAVQLVLEDLAGLPQDLPLRSFQLAGTFYASFAKVGKAAEARAILVAHRAKLAERVANTKPDVSSAATLKSASHAHRKGYLHADWDTGNADDEPGFDRDRFLAAVAFDRVKLLDSMLKGPPKLEP